MVDEAGQLFVHSAQRVQLQQASTNQCLQAARLATAQGQYQRAATLFGLAEQMGRRIGYRAPEPVCPHTDAALEPAIFAEAFASGQGMTLAEAFADLRYWSLAFFPQYTSDD